MEVSPLSKGDNSQGLRQGRVGVADAKGGARRRHRSRWAVSIHGHGGYGRSWRSNPCQGRDSALLQMQQITKSPEQVKVLRVKGTKQDERHGKSPGFAVVKSCVCAA